MDLTEEQRQLRERYVIALIEATQPLQKESADQELTMELLIQAAGMLQEHLQKELEELREEQD
jgi:AraC-like DNA-binding protein